MKSRFPLLAAALIFGCAIFFPTSSNALVLLTSDTVVAPFDTSYDGSDLVVSNCVLTIDGLHHFSNLRLADGARMTHSSVSNGVISSVRSVSDQQKSLTGTQANPLTHTLIDADSVVIKDISGTITYTNAIDYELIPLNGLLWLKRTDASSIPDGAVVSISYNYTAVTPTGVHLIIAHDLQIDLGSVIDVSGCGFDGSVASGRGNSTGLPLNGGGGGHAGYGGGGLSNALGGNVFDSQFWPTNKGGAGGTGSGGPGGTGGGAVQIEVNGTLDLQGSIVANGANGTNSRSGGGAGGSIWLTAQNVIGTGLISADGGNGEPVHAGGGGGGRIALYFTTNNFAGPILNRGGLGFVPGGAGTTYVTNQFGNSWTSGGANARLLLDNGGRSGTNTSLVSIGSADLKVANGAIGSLPSSFACSNAVVEPNGFLTSALSITAEISALGDVVIKPGGGFVADGTSTDSPPGSGGSIGSAGAGHGGYGGAATNSFTIGNCYGSITDPKTLGSRGAPDVKFGAIRGGGGGGGFQLLIGGTLTVNGRISVNGKEGTGGATGGGSGGSIEISSGVLTGNGEISANGGAGSNGGGGGGGGRIAIYSSTNLFNGLVSAFGGSGKWNGGAGTIYTKNDGVVSGSTVLDNNNLAGKTSVRDLVQGNLIIRRGAIGIASGQSLHINIDSLLVESNAFLSTLNGQNFGSMIYITVAKDTIIEQGGGIIGDGAGSPSTSGPGGGHNYGTGAGYGGSGGRGSNGSSGGDSVGAPTFQIQAGSGGDPYQNAYAKGGSGGGGIALSVKGRLRLDGIISVNANDGFSSITSFPAGGGAGGGLQVIASEFSGNGGIYANGGNGTNGGGGGGGGRVTIGITPPISNLFTGTISAHGGTGFQAGGAGTISFFTNSPESGLTIIDNNGIQGTNTPLLNVSGTMTYLIRNGGVAMPKGPLWIGNLTISSNGVVMPPSGSSLNLTVSGNASIERGGRLIANDAGSGAGTGAGIGTGGGHGGEGGSNSAGSAAGMSYDSATSPQLPGSMGTPVSGTSQGGAGGGVVQLDVSGTLNVDGNISADGQMGNSTATQGPLPAVGGGSGGTIVLNANKLTGTGVISANGGSGLNGGGGGGGGRIAITYSSNSFGGTLSAYGGAGFYNGGAGTIFLKSPFSQIGTLLIDNGGLDGTITPLTYLNDDVQVGGNAKVVWNNAVGLGSLLVRSNGWMISRNNYSLVISRDAVIEAGGVITADGRSGPEAGDGSSAGSPKGGASHGGYGGGNAGGVYDSIIDPSRTGSQGGNGSGSPFISPRGGNGGGIIVMRVDGSLSVTGRISSDGFNGELNSGGGSGGTVSLTVGGLAGPGIISANGGDGNAAGGGGGGRIAITYSSNTFSGNLSARGGTGTSAGGAGSIYLKNKALFVGDLIVDNGGVAGTNTPLAAIYQLPSTPFDLTISNQAIVSTTEPLLRLRNLTIGTYGSLTLLPGQTNLTIAANTATIQRHGTITADGAGFSQAEGFGAGGVVLNSGKYEGAGGGHGGHGGNSAAGAVGGTNYDSMTHPVNRGSGGGFGNGPAFETLDSRGGGAIRFKVSGNLTVDGAVIANGKPGLQDDAGGGAGGSIWISATTLTGTGRISANGGDGELFRGGGGGGGRVAVYSRTNAFSGLIQATGGDGAFPGEPGTVYFSQDFANGFQITSHTPTGSVSVAVSSIDLEFNDIVGASSLSASDFALITPAGAVPIEALQISMPDLTTVRVSFPTQTLNGEYQLTAGPNISNIFGESMPQIYSGTFSISATTISVALQGSDLMLNWFGNSGVQYQIYSSTNLVDWLPFGDPIPGNNAMIELPLPTEGAPAMYFRVEVK